MSYTLCILASFPSIRKSAEIGGEPWGRKMVQVKGAWSVVVPCAENTAPQCGSGTVPFRCLYLPFGTYKGVGEINESSEIRSITAFSMGAQVHVKRYLPQKPNRKEKILLEQRVKTGLALTQKRLNLCDENLRKAEVSSRNSFVEKAIEYYAGYLNAEQNSRYFENAFASKA